MQSGKNNQILRSVICYDPDHRLFYLNELHNGKIMILPNSKAVGIVKPQDHYAKG